MKVYIKNRKRRKDEFQFFMHNFVDECKSAGFESIYDFFPSYKFHVRSLLKRGELLLYQLVKRWFPKLIKKKQAVIITANGETIAENAFPYYFGYEIIPMLWDVWPSKWDQMYKDFKLFDCKLVFVTVKSVANKIEQELGIKAVWIPEGINCNLYNMGDDLINRRYDILEMGRHHIAYHKILTELFEQKKIDGYLSSQVLPDGRMDDKNLLFKNEEEMQKTIPQCRVMICFPHCDTNPSIAGNVETLTQRYWEAMLSRCVMIGRAPQELIEIIGYNPVIEVDWSKPEVQICDILKNIQTYQQLVDKNLQTALTHAPWIIRINKLKETLIECGYDL